jgi:hypothetical protein
MIEGIAIASELNTGNDLSATRRIVTDCTVNAVADVTKAIGELLLRYQRKLKSEKPDHLSLPPGASE